MLLGNSPDQRANFRDKQARLTRPDLQSDSDVHAKLAEEHHSKKPRESVNQSTNSKTHWKITVYYLMTLKLFSASSMDPK